MRLKKSRVACASVVIFSAILANGQKSADKPATTVAPQFAYDVVSIRPSRIENGSERETDDGLYYESTTLEYLIDLAYKLRRDYVSGAPGWVKSETFEFEAKMSPETAEALKKLPRRERYLQRCKMLEAVLEDRFHLKARTVTKEISIYNLVIAKNGLKIKEADPNNTYANGLTVNKKPLGADSMQIGYGRLIAQGVSMESLADTLENSIDRPVEDKTGLRGSYDLALTWSPDEMESSGSAEQAGSIFTALQEQVGLKLVPAKEMTDMIIVDHVERPTPN